MGVLALAACADNATTAPVARPAAVSFEKNVLAFTPLASSVACTTGGTPSAMFSVPGGFVQANIASEPDYLGNPDMITQNETGPESGRYIFQTHELGLGSNTGVSRTDLFTGQTKMVVQRNETNPGFIFKFTPDTYADLSSGQLYALRITNPTGDRVGDAEWIPLDRAAVQVDANAAAAAAGATGYNRPEDVEIGTSSGDDHGPDNILYLAVTGPSNPVDNRVIAIDLHEPRGGNNRSTAFVYDYVKWGLNVAQADFEMPDNVALDHDGNLFITEDPATAPNTKRGDDIWVARPPAGKPHQPAVSVERFASLTDCGAEPTGIYVDLRSNTLFVHAQHRGGDGLDKTVAILRQ
jgi:hypothetical protein